MFNVGGGELIVILIAALILLGPDKLPNAARQVGKYMAEFRKISQGFQDELRSAMDITAVPDPDPVAYPPAEPAASGTTPEPDPPVAPPESPAAEASESPPAEPTASGPTGPTGPAGPTAMDEAAPRAEPLPEASPIHDVGPTGPTAA